MNGTKPIYRFFFAHPKAMAADEITNTRTALLAWMQARQPSIEVELTSGRDDYDQHFKRCGSWDAWAEDVATGITYATREPRFHGFIIPGRSCGAATARIVRSALNARKPVWCWTGSGLVPIYSLERAGNSFKDGWRLS